MDDERPASKKDLEELKAELKADMGRLEEGLRADMGRMEVGLKADMGRMEVELKADMGRTEDRLIEKMRDMQTELLRAFGPFQEVVNLRIRTVEANTSNDSVAVKARLDIVERRLFQIEKKLLLDPPS